MTVTGEAPATDRKGLGFFERWLTLWVGLCIGGGNGVALVVERLT